MTQDLLPLICFLTESEVANDLCLRYWARTADGRWNETFQTLLSDTGLKKGEMILMLKTACRLHFPPHRCSRCGTPLSVATRSEYSSLAAALGKSAGDSPTQVCTSCSATLRAPRQSTKFFNPQGPRERVAEALKRLHENANLVDYTKLSIFHSCLLYAALISANMTPGDHVIPSLEDQTGELAPTPELASEVYGHLCAAGILLPALSSDLNAFDLDEHTGALTASVGVVDWTLAKDPSGTSIDEILAVLFQRLDQPTPKDVEALWYLVAEDECRKYFVSQWERYNFAHPAIYSAKVATIIQLYLRKCSIGQMWNIIYYAVKNLAALTQEGRYTPQHVYNMLPGAIRRYAEYRLGNTQSPHPWRRQPPAKESWMTSILLDKILKAGDISFERLKGEDVSKYVEYLLSKPDGIAAAAFFRPTA